MSTRLRCEGLVSPPSVTRFSHVNWVENIVKYGRQIIIRADARGIPRQSPVCVDDFTCSRVGGGTKVVYSNG